MERYQNGDFESFDLFYRRNNELIFAFLSSRLRHRADAEEAFQETFLKIHKSIPSYDPTQSAMGWVFTIARNTAIDTQRRRHRHGANHIVEDLSENARTEEKISAREELSQLLNLLSEEERSLLATRFLHDEPIENIAESFGITADNTRQRLSRLVKKIKNHRSS